MKRIKRVLDMTVGGVFCEHGDESSDSIKEKISLQTRVNVNCSRINP